MSKSKQKGTLAETAVVSFLRTQGFPHAERLALQGTKDRGDVTGIPGVVIEVKNEAEYTFAGWLKEAAVEKENAKADHAFVAAKPRMIGLTKVGAWYAIMPEDGFMNLVGQASTPDWHVRLWVVAMSGANINRDISKYMGMAASHGDDSGATHSCVRIAPKGVKDPSMYYVVTTLVQMSDLLVRAGYGRIDD